MYVSLVIAALFATTAATSEPAAAQAAPSRKAVVVGINRYDEHPSATRGPLNRLSGAVPDANAMADLLRTTFHFDDVLLLTDERATRDGILAAIRRTLVDGAKPGDVRVFYYSGHGSQVGNTASRELDKLDETIVPYDYATAPDLRDKELARALGGVIDAGAILTAMFDSCHSGSGLRGDPPPGARGASVDPRTVSDPGLPVQLEQRGALVLSAAQDLESALEVKTPPENKLRGAFTFALVEALKEGGLDEPAQRIYLRAKWRMKDFSSQTPVLAGTLQRQGATLFDSAPAKIGAFEVSVRRNGKHIEVDAGLASGLGIGSVLARKASPELKLEVTSLEGATKGFAEIREGNPASLGDGGLFEVEQWAALPGTNFVVHIPEGVAPPVLRQRIADLNALREAGRVEWLDAADPPLEAYGLTWERTPKGPRWILHQPDTKTQWLTPKELRAWQPPAGPRPRVLAILPPPLPLANALRARWNQPGGLVTVTSSSSDAHYRLVGRMGPNGVEYAWSRAAKLDNGPALPERTDYAAVTAAQGGADAAASALGDSAERIARAYGWFNLQSPPGDDEKFPFRLVLRREDGILRHDGERLQSGERYGLVLEPSAPATSPVDRRWVYVFALDSFGKRTLVYPQPELGDVENLFPLPDKEGEPVVLAENLFNVSAPYGTDTFFLFASAQKLMDSQVLDEEGVRTLKGERGKDPDTLLLGLLTPALMRGVTRSVVPATWTVRHIAITSAEPSP